MKISAYKTIAPKPRIFSANRYWSGKLILIGVWKWVICVDLRKDWISDMTNGRMTKKDLPE